MATAVYVESSVLALPIICINGGRRGLLISLAPDTLTSALGARPTALGRIL